MRISGENKPWETMGGCVQDPVTALVVSSVIGAAGVGASVYASKKQSSAAKKSRQQADAAARRQKISLDAQQAVTNRQRVDADRRETEISGQLASQRRAVVARRGSRGQLAFSGANTGLKQTFGG